MKLSIKKTIEIILIAGLIISCNSKMSEKDRQEKSMALMKEGADFIAKGMNVEFSDSLQAKLFYRQSLDKFLAALAIDTTQKKVGQYLPDLYGKLHMYDSVNYWRTWLGEYNQ